MKKIMPHVASIFFTLFGAGVVVLLMSYTFKALAYIFPDNFIAQIMGMILFDIAALAWLAAFIYLCKSVMQYSFAFLGFVVGLLGSLVMVAIEVMLGGQEMIDPPAWINSVLIYGFIAAAVVHVILFYAYKLTAPEVSADISLGIETAQITDEAMKQAEEVLLRERGALGSVIAPRLVDNVRRNLGLPVRGDVIDLEPFDVNEPLPVQISPARQNTSSFMDRLRAAGQILVGQENAKRQRQAPPAHTPAPQPDTPPKQESTHPPMESEDSAGMQSDPLSGFSDNGNGHK